MITTFEICLVWIKYILIMFLFGIMSILSIILFPISYFFRYIIKWDILYFLLSNDPNDGDIGGEWWLLKNNLSSGFFTSWRWTIRNSAWYFKTTVFLPDWNPDNYRLTRVVSNTIGRPLDWVTQEMRGTNHAYFNSNGNTYFRYSFTNNFINMYMGVGGKRYVFKLRRSYKAIN